MFETQNPTLGHITCPMCGNPSATVHRAKGRNRRLYFRCYADAGAMLCGTIQPQGPAGQQYIAEAVRWLAPNETEAAAQAAAEAASAATREAVREGRREQHQKRSMGFLASWLSEDE